MNARANGARRGHVEVRELSVAFEVGRESHLAVEKVSLEARPGEFVSLLGPSGCGKSTVLNVVAGYVVPGAGEVTVDGEAVRGPGPDRGMVFQQHSLFPWKTVAANVAFGPLMAGQSRGGAESVARTFLSMVGLAAFEKRYPGTLSGGMEQRVGIARALANYPSVLLMDEPFGALDAQTRAMMQESLLGIWGEFHTTVLFVTHDIDEAVFLSDRVLVMSASPGRILADITVNLPRPRSDDTLVCPEFMTLKAECLRLIREESRRAHESQNASRAPAGHDGR